MSLSQNQPNSKRTAISLHQPTGGLEMDDRAGVSTNGANQYLENEPVEEKRVEQRDNQAESQ